MHCNRNRGGSVGAGLGRSPAFVAVLGLLQSDQVKLGRGIVGSPLVAEPRFPFFVGTIEVGVRRCAVSRIDDMDVVRKSVRLDLLGVDILTNPAYDARYQPGFTARFDSGEQSLVFFIFQIFDTVPTQDIAPEGTRG